MAGRTDRSPVCLPMQPKLGQAFVPVGWRGLVVASVLAVAGCAKPGPSAPPASYLDATRLGAQADVSAPIVSPTWWRDLDEPALAALIDRALAEAPSLRVAAARLTRAQAIVDGARAASEPMAQLSLDASRQRFTEHGLVPAALAGTVRNLATVQSGVTWEVDFFGRHEAGLQSALGQQRALQAEAHAARNLLASQLARGYAQLARLIEQHDLARQVLEQRERVLALQSQRRNAGLDDERPSQATRVAIAEQRTRLAALDEAITLARHALAALSAQPPAALAQLAPRLTLAPRLPMPAEVPADLIGRRADLVAARWRVESAVQDAALARTQFYPNVNLGALVGLSSIGLDRLIRAGSLQASAGPAIRLPLFDGGRLRANLQARQAEVDLAIETYNQTLVEAIREVADQLGSLRALARQQDEQSRAEQAAQAAQTLAEQRLKAGIGDRLAVLTAQAGVLTQRQQTLELTARRLDSQFALIRALGGGYVAEGP